MLEYSKANKLAWWRDRSITISNSYCDSVRCCERQAWRMQINNAAFFTATIAKNGSAKRFLAKVVKPVRQILTCSSKSILGALKSVTLKRAILEQRDKLLLSLAFFQVYPPFFISLTLHRMELRQDSQLKEIKLFKHHVASLMILNQGEQIRNADVIQLTLLPVRSKFRPNGQSIIEPRFCHTKQPHSDVSSEYPGVHGTREVITNTIRLHFLLIDR